MLAPAAVLAPTAPSARMQAVSVLQSGGLDDETLVASNITIPPPLPPFAFVATASSLVWPAPPPPPM